MNKYAVMVDSSCNLPRDLVESLGMVYVPNQVQVGDALLDDDGDPERAVAFFANGFDNGKVNAEIIPVTPEAYLQVVKERAVLACDHLLLLTPQRDLSVLYQNANKGLVSIATASMDQRMKAGRKEIMRVDIEDSRSVFSPHGLVAWEAALALKNGSSMAEVRAHLTKLVPQTMGYFVVNNVKYIYNRARDARDKPNAMLFAVGNVLDIKPIVRRQGSESETVGKIRGFEAAVAKLFERIERLIKDGQLIVPRILISYSGPLADLKALPGFALVEKTAQAAGVQVATSVMGYSCGVFMGAASLAIGLAAKPHKF